MPRTSRRLIALGLLLVGAGTAWARMDEAAFRRTATQVKRVAGKPGHLDEKLPLLKALAEDDTQRATEVMFAWTRASIALVEKSLASEVAKRQEDLDAYAAKLVKKYGEEKRESWSEVEQSRHEKRRLAWEEAKTELEIETRVQSDLAAGVGKVTDAEALDWLASTGVPGLLADRVHGPLLEACFGRLLEGPPSAVQNAVLAVLQRPLAPAVALRGLMWVGMHKPPDAALRLGACLAAPSPAVQRMAVKILTMLDDPRSVPLLIDGLKGNAGLPAAEMEELLQRFTGKAFSADHDAWKRWWSAEGEAWLAALDAAKRFDPLSMTSGVSFYGIRTPSKRVAFVLDRSGSMQAPAIFNAANTPFTSKDGKESWAGKTRLEVAQIQLARTINNLASDAFFTILFYDFKVDTWKQPPNIVPATRENKAEAQKWFMPLQPGSSTSLFDGLMKALEYAEDIDARTSPEGTEGDKDRERIDTIFLLSDGAPTHYRAAPLGDPYATEKTALERYEAAVEAAYQVFKKANGERGIVVHAIGVGQEHNEKLMKRIAADSGGKYVAVGMD